MKSNKSVVSKFNEFRPDSETLKQLQNVLLHILKDVAACCDKHGLKYMLIGGTLLGAIRHSGFIPWDDDIDIVMPRSDYEKIAAAIADCYGDKYYVEDPRTSACSHKMIKVFLNGTTYVPVGMDNDDAPVCKSICIDIFPIDNIPAGKCRIRALRYNIAFHATSLIYDYKYPSHVLAEKCKVDAEAKKYFRMRKRMGRFFSIFGGFKHYMRVVMKLANYKKETEYLACPIGGHYNKQKLKRESWSEVAETEFCGIMFKIPLHYKDYLEMFYGSDYMTLPPPEKREVHPAVKIDFGIYDNLDENGSFKN